MIEVVGSGKMKSFLHVLLLTALSCAYGEVTPLWNKYKWGPNVQAWCRFPCLDNKIPAGTIFKVSFSGPTKEFTTFGNLRLLAADQTSYIVESNYDIWSWGDGQFCQFQFGLIYEGIQLQGNCSIPTSISSIPLQANFLQSTIQQSGIPKMSTQELNIPKSNFKQSNVIQQSILQADIAKSSIPQSSLPQMSIQQSIISQSSLPQMSTQEVNIPTQSSISQWNPPQMSIPAANIPQSRISQSSLPQMSTQEVNIPAQSSISQWNLPQMSIPAANIPQSSISQSSAPQTSIQSQSATGIYEPRDLTAQVSAGIDLATWDNTLRPETGSWRYQGRCTVYCMGTYEPGALVIKMIVDKDTTNFNGFGAFDTYTPASNYSRTWTVINKKRIKSKYGLCEFDFELDHLNESPIPKGSCYTV